MKRWGVVFLLLALLTALTGCTAAQDEEDKQSTKGIMIEKLDSGGVREFIIEDEEAAGAFFDEYLNFPERYASVGTEGLTEACSYVVWQDKTIHAGETEPSGMERIMLFTLYEDSNVATMQLLPDEDLESVILAGVLTMSCDIGADKASYLKEYKRT